MQGPQPQPPTPLCFARTQLIFAVRHNLRRADEALLRLIGTTSPVCAVAPFVPRSHEPARSIPHMNVPSRWFHTETTESTQRAQSFSLCPLCALCGLCVD